MTRSRSRAARRKAGAGRLTPRRRALFFAVTIAFPLLLFVIAEGALRLFGYGPNLALFDTEVLAGKPYLVMNPAVKGRYFSRVAFNPSTSPDYFAAPKPPGTFRIFCLGGSTTVGYPYWYNGSFSSFLRDRLRRLFPDRRIEVVNLGMTATNSFTVNDMARELPAFEPDLLVVYDGHNEFYGALGVASNESPGRARWVSRLLLRLVRWKTFLLLRDLYGALRGSIAAPGAPEAGETMMERLASGQLVPYGGDLYRAGLATYAANLEELRDIAAGVPVLLGSQVSNLRDLFPFVSAHAPDTPAEDSARCAQLLAAGRDRMHAGDFAAAAEHFRSAAALDTQFAAAHYGLARCLDTLGADRDAERAYLLARDMDQLRFRMSSDFNATMRISCTSGRIIFVDHEAVFRAASPDSLIGGSLLVEHLHPNARGYFLMARAYARAMAGAGILAPQDAWRERDTLDEHHLWEDRPLTELDERIAARRTEILTSGWPFREGAPEVDAVGPADTLGEIAEKVTRGRWNWLQAHNAAAAWYLERGDLRRAEREYRTIINQLPLLDAAPYLTLAKLYIDTGRFRDAEEMLTGSLTVKPTILAYRALGDIALRSGRPGAAVDFYDRTFTFPQSPPEQVENGHLLALACAGAGDTARARAALLKVLAIRPDHRPAAELLARLGPAR